MNTKLTVHSSMGFDVGKIITLTVPKSMEEYTFIERIRWAFTKKKTYIAIQKRIVQVVDAFNIEVE